MSEDVQLIDPATGELLFAERDRLRTRSGSEYPVVNGIPRICPRENYAASFGTQWNRFPRTQLGDVGFDLSRRRFFRETGWTAADLDGLSVLEVGCGAGRFSKVVLELTRARLWSIDYSDAVDANLSNNGTIAPERFHLLQASIYAMPFPDGSFDRLFCLGVLQHTPDFEASVKALIQKVRPGGEIVVDFYPIRHALTKVSAKYALRPLTTRIPEQRLLGLIDRNIDWMIRAFDALNGAGLGMFTRFLPIADLRCFPGDLTRQERREWAVLDTFDTYSPQHDHPQKIGKVARMFERHGAEVAFADYVDLDPGNIAVIRARRT